MMCCNVSRLGRCWLTALIIMVSTPIVWADVMTPELVAQLRAVSSAAVSPDGSLIAYTVAVPRNPFAEEDGKSFFHLYVDDRSGLSRPFVTGNETVSAPSFTPDGTGICYLAKRDENKHKALWYIPATGGESRILLEFASDITDYAWSPDNWVVAFLAKDTISDPVKRSRERGFDQQVFEEDWTAVRLWLYNTSDSTTAPTRVELNGSAHQLLWSPDGRLLATTVAPTPSVDDRYMSRKITLVDARDGSTVRQYETPGKLGRMAFSPDGSHLAFIAGADINDPSEGELWLASVDNDSITKLIADFTGHVSGVAWTDNGTLVFLSDIGVNSALGHISIDGSSKTTTLLETGPVFTSLAVSADGTAGALIGNAPTHPSELFTFAPNDSVPSPKRITVTNPQLDRIEFGRQLVIDYTSRDGLAQNGILVYPLGYEKGRRYPLILCVHGGPESHIRNGWITSYAYPGQVAAARGMATFYPNYRGSTGRGIEFSKLGQADYAGGEFNDLVDAVDHLVALGVADSARVGITGRSYGGYATAWAATALSERFACGVMGAGVSDLISKFGTTDIPMEMYYSHARTWPWDNWQFYLERSPIYHAHNSRTPLLILHGENDTRVHPSQSMELYRYLKTHGNAPVRLVVYQDEPHGTEKAAARYDSHLRMMRWLEHYLLGPGGPPPDFEVDYSALQPAGN